MWPCGRGPMAASESQREKIVGRWCIVCRWTKGITSAHLTPRALGGCDDPECVVPLWWLGRTVSMAHSPGDVDSYVALFEKFLAEVT
jgi:hypothetical protein